MVVSEDYGRCHNSQNVELVRQWGHGRDPCDRFATRDQSESFLPTPFTLAHPRGGDSDGIREVVSDVSLKRSVDCRSDPLGSSRIEHGRGSTSYDGLSELS